MKLIDLRIERLDERLGNLAKLNVGPLINVLKQQSHINRRHGAETGPVGKKFVGYDIGSTSEIIDVGQLKDGLKSLRKAYRNNEGAAAFAVYIGDTPVMFGTFAAETLAGSSRTGRLAYDLTPFSDTIEKMDVARKAAMPSYQQYGFKPTEKTTYREREPSSWEQQKGKTTPDRYQGGMFSTADLSVVFDKIMEIAKSINQPITAKLVMSDKEAREKRSKRFSNREIDAGKNDLMTRLKRFKLSKKPSVDTIEEFVKYALANPGKTVQFAGATYNIASSNYEKIDANTLFRGQPFKVSYSCADPGNYDSLTMTYAFDPSTQMLTPIEATWYDKRDPANLYKRQHALLDGTVYAKTKLPKVDINKQEQVIPVLLKMMKDDRLHDLLLLIKALKKSGKDWKQLDIIENIALAEKGNKSA